MYSFPQVSEREYRQLSGLLTGLVILAFGLLGLALLQNSLAERQLHAARQCALLSVDGLWIYSVTQPSVAQPPPPGIAPGTMGGAMVLVRPPQPGSDTAPSADSALSQPPPDASPFSDAARPPGDWQSLFHGMQLQHERLRIRYPRQTHATDAAWKAFALSLRQTNQVNWREAAAFSDAFRALADTLQSQAIARRNQTLIFSGLGVVILLSLFAWASSLLHRRRQVALRLEADKERLETILEATGEGVYQVDERGLCTYINPAGAALLGYQPRELQGKEMANLLYQNPDEGGASPSEQRLQENPILRALQTSSVVRHDDDLLRRRDGTSFPAATLASPIHIKGSLRGLVVTFSDSTERKQAETLRDDLTGMIVHDLRTPLTSLLTGMQTLHLVGDREGIEQEILDNAIRGGESLLGMINDLLDISKMEAGLLTLDKKPLQAAHVIEYALAQTAPLARTNGLRVARHLPADLPTLEADQDKLRRTLVNLLGNAVKFTPRGGIVTVSASFDPAEQAVVFAVGDTGEGIPAHAVKRIFDKFGQVESRRAGRKMSTGLGLTFCKLVAEAHHGRIWVESKLGKGSRFLFTIPVPLPLSRTVEGNPAVVGSPPFFSTVSDGPLSG